MLDPRGAIPLAPPGLLRVGGIASTVGRRKHRMTKSNVVVRYLEGGCKRTCLVVVVLVSVASKASIRMKSKGTKKAVL